MENFKGTILPLDYTRRIAIYGKGGIGKSTITANLAVAASKLGLSTMVVGCDPKADSIHTLIKEKGQIKTILDTIRKKGTSASALRDCIYKGFNEIVCVESGGPAPGVGCAGKGVAVALELLKKHNYFDKSLNLILFDVLGDVVCGGFAQPMRENFAKEVCIVTSGEFMSIYQAVNIASSIASMAQDGLEVRMLGLVCNKRDVAGEEEIVKYLSELIEVPVIMSIPRANCIQQAESLGTTVVEAFPNSSQAKIYYELAARIYNNTNHIIPKVRNRHETLEKVKKIIGRYSDYGTTEKVSS